MKFNTPKTDLLVAFIQQELIAGNIAEGTAQEISLLMIESATEAAESITKICDETMNDYKYRQLWLGFGLGIVATLVIAAVGIAAYFNFN